MFRFNNPEASTLLTPVTLFLGIRYPNTLKPLTILRVCANVPEILVDCGMIFDDLFFVSIELCTQNPCTSSF